MRFKYGMPPEVDCRLNNKSKLVVDYPRLHIKALMLGLLILGPSLYLMWRSMWSNDVILGTLKQPPEVFIPSLLLLIILHEFVHLLLHPRAGLSRDSLVGILPKGFMAYASYQGEQSRQRLIATLLAPLAALTFLPFLFASFAPPVIVTFLPGLSILNGVASAGDILLTFMAIRMIPHDAICHGEYFGFRATNDHNSSTPT